MVKNLKDEGEKRREQRKNEGDEKKRVQQQKPEKSVPRLSSTGGGI